MNLNTDLTLTNSVHDFKLLLDRFITDKKISTNLEIIDETINVILDYKKSFAKFNIRNMDTVKIFSGLNLLQNFLACSKNHLIQGIKRKENPVSAEQVYEFMDEIVELANKIDSFKLNSTKDIPNLINSQAIELREELRNNELYPKINELENLKDKETKIISSLFAEKTIQRV